MKLLPLTHPPQDYLSSAHYPEHSYRGRDLAPRIGPGAEYDNRMPVNYVPSNQYEGLYGSDRQRYTNHSRRADHQRKTILPTPTMDDR